MNDYSAHRRALGRLLHDGLILISGGVEIARNNDVNYVFRQHSHFLYLTGVPEPGYYLLIDPKRRQDILFIPKVDAHHRVWLGHVPSPAEAKARYPMARVEYADQISSALKKCRKGYRRVYADKQSWKHFRQYLPELANSSSRLEDALQSLRICKTAGEIDRMRRANQVSAEGHLAVMAAVRPGIREYELQSEFEGVCLRQGLTHQAYPPIVAAGANGAVLHYQHNNAVLKKGDLLLIDAAAEYEGYAADITRTLPVDGRFTQRQRDIYSIVLDAQKQCIERARPGILSGELHLHSMQVLAEGLRSLGFLRGSIEDLVFGGAVRLFYPHGLSHTLGLDVHDTLGGKRRQVPAPKHVRVRFNARLEPGFAITMEPGIYFNAALINDKMLREKYRKQVNFAKAESFLDFGGVRIEDDIVIQAHGPAVNLTAVPKEIKDVEAACRARPRP